MLRLLKEKGVGVVLIGMSTIDAMEPAPKLMPGMKEHMLATKDARYSPAWIWGMSDMRAITAASMAGMGAARCCASITVQRPVPFWPARSRIMSSIGRPEWVSVAAATSAEISIR